MRWSVFFLLSGFFAFSLYIGWEQGAFAFRKEQMALSEMPEKTKPAAAKKESSTQQAIDQLLKEMKEPLKSQLQAPIKEGRLDDAVAMLETEMGKQKLSVSYGVVLQLAEKKEKTESNR